jgi:hypothetical protein
LPFLANGLMTCLDGVSVWLPVIGQDMLTCCVSLVLLLLIFKEMVGQPVATALLIPICLLGIFFPFFAGQYLHVLMEFIFPSLLFDRLVLDSRWSLSFCQDLSLTFSCLPLFLFFNTIVGLICLAP